jgi:hypothetical protein
MCRIELSPLHISFVMVFFSFTPILKFLLRLSAFTRGEGYKATPNDIELSKTLCVGHDTSTILCVVNG